MIRLRASAKVNLALRVGRRASAISRSGRSEEEPARSACVRPPGDEGRVWGGEGAVVRLVQQYRQFAAHQAYVERAPRDAHSAHALVQRACIHTCCWAGAALYVSLTLWIENVPSN